MVNGHARILFPSKEKKVEKNPHLSRKMHVFFSNFILFVVFPPIYLVNAWNLCNTKIWKIKLLRL